MTISNNHKRKGIAILWVMIFAMALVAFLALVIDVARICVVGHQLHNAADAAALAGARYVIWDPNSTTKIIARKKALEYAEYNFANQLPVKLHLNTGNDPDGDIVIGRYTMQNRTFTPNLNTPNAMKVVARMGTQDSSVPPISKNTPLPLIFGRMFKVGDVSIRKYAIAIIYGGTGAGLIALADRPVDKNGKPIPGLEFNSGGLDVENGAIHINAEWPWTNGQLAGLSINGQPDFNAEEINVVGDAYWTGGFDPVDDINYADDIASLNTGTDPIQDPLGDLPEPTYSTATDLGTISAAGTYSPGYYSGGIETTGGPIYLEPGIYHLGGGTGKGGLVIGGSTDFYADGVMFHILPDHTNADGIYIEPGKIDIDGTGNVHISAIDLDDSDLSDTNDTIVYPPDSRLPTYEAVAIFQSRDNTEPARIIGTGLLDLYGTIYLPVNHLTLGGEGDGFGNQLIAASITISGTGIIKINYLGDEPAVANKSTLVE
jgi:hypothetical protein